jgi:hypothetical protein
MRRPGLALLVATAFAGAGCEDTVPTTPTTPSTPTFVTDTFSGTVNRNGAQTFSFNVQASGTVVATLKSVMPDKTVAVGLALGTWNGAVCQIVLPNDNALEGATVTGSAGSAGLLCIRIYDVGKIVDLLSFEVTVVHP